MSHCYRIQTASPLIFYSRQEDSQGQGKVMQGGSGNAPESCAGRDKQQSQEMSDGELMTVVSTVWQPTAAMQYNFNAVMKTMWNHETKVLHLRPSSNATVPSANFCGLKGSAASSNRLPGEVHRLWYTTTSRLLPSSPQIRSDTSSPSAGWPMC